MLLGVKLVSLLQALINLSLMAFPRPTSGNFCAMSKSNPLSSNLCMAAYRFFAASSKSPPGDKTSI